MSSRTKTSAVHPSILRVRAHLQQRATLAAARNKQRLFQEADRLKRLPQYLFSILDDLKAQAKQQGIDVIDLGMGNPDLAPPADAVAGRQPQVPAIPGRAPQAARGEEQAPLAYR